MGLIEYLSRRKEEREKRKAERKEVKGLIRVIEGEREEILESVRQNHHDALAYLSHKVAGVPSEKDLATFLETCSPKTQRKYSYYMRT